MALDFIAGCLGGCAGVAIGHPLDTVKVKLQTQDFRNPVYRGTLDCFTKILQTESLSGVYRGVWSPMCGVALVNAVVFGVYGNLQRSLVDPDSLRSHFLAGGLSGLAQSVVSSPVELIKTRMQTSSFYQGTMDCFLNIFKSEGIHGVFKGLSITGARDFLGYGFYFATYEVCTRNSGDVPVGTSTMLLAGGMSGIVSWVFTYPLDVVKTRFQADKGTYSGLVDCLKKSVQNEGVSCLCRGLWPTIIRAFPTNAVTFTVVTWAMRCADYCINESASITTILDSVVEKLPKEKLVIANADLDESICNLKCNNWIFRVNPQKYLLMAEDFWVGNELPEDKNFKIDTLDADLRAAELKMFDDLEKETKQNESNIYSKVIEREEVDKKDNR